MTWSAALSGAASRVLRTAAGRRVLQVALLVGGLLVIGLLCGERADAADGAVGRAAGEQRLMMREDAHATAVRGARPVTGGGDARGARAAGERWGPVGSSASSTVREAPVGVEAPVLPSRPESPVERTLPVVPPVSEPVSEPPGLPGSAAPPARSAESELPRRFEPPGLPPAPELPGLSQLPAQPMLPVEPMVPVEATLPALPGPSLLPGQPDPPALPSLPTLPDLSPLPDVPALPGGVPSPEPLPDLPTPLPDLPDVPALPGVPSPVPLPTLPEPLPDLPTPLPDLPDVPTLPGVPSPVPLPDLPDVPALPGVPSPVPLPDPPGEDIDLPGVPGFPVPPGLPEAPGGSVLPGQLLPAPVTATPQPGEGAVPSAGVPDSVGRAVATASPRAGGHRAVRTVHANHHPSVARDGHAPADEAPADRPDGTPGNRSSADNGTPRHGGDLYAVAVSRRVPPRLVPGAAARGEAASTRDAHRDVPLFPG